MADFDPDAFLAGGLPDAPPAPAAGSQAFDPDAFIKDFDPDAFLNGSAPTGPAPEGPLATGVREGAHAVVPGLGALAGMGYGAAVGSVGGPVGAFAGAVVGGVAAGMGVGYVQEKALNAAGFDDSEQRAANELENPNSALAGQIGGGMVGMSPSAVASPLVKGAANQLIQRGAGGAFGGVMEAGHEAFEGDGFSAKKIGANIAAGAAMPGVNKLGQKFVNAGGRIPVPGRPGVTRDPAEASAHEAVGDTSAEIEVGDSSLVQSPPTVGDAQVETTGNPQSAPVRSSRVYKKGSDPAEQSRYGEALSDPEVMREFAADQGLTEAEAREIAQANYRPEGDMLTKGDVAPDVAAALKVEEPAAAPAPAPPAPENSDPGLFKSARVPQPEQPAFPKAQEAIAYSKREQPMDATFPQEGDPLAVGANEATKVPERALPRNETAVNASVTDAQLKAGNYPKERTHDFGRPQRIETYAGDTRRGTGPDGTPWENKADYDYGYFNKTIGKDKDHVDFARPPQGHPDRGDKHFVIDQKNAETGKFDEHKVFTDYKDEATARRAYESGFSDSKGGDRLGAIKEISRRDLVDVLAKHHKKPWNKPYSMTEEGAVKSTVGAVKPAQERAVIKDLITKAEAAGDTAKAEAIRNAPEEKLLAAAEGKRLRKYGTSTGNSAGYPVAGIAQADGRPVTANTKLKAQERSAIHKEMENWFAKSAPKENESNGALLERIRDIPPSSWKPAHKPASWMLANEAKRLLQKPTPGAIKKFREAERLLRGKPEDVDNYRGGNRVEADIARSKRSGDEAVANAEAKNVDLGVNHVEDEMVARIDAKRGGKFDVPHEEAESMVQPKPVKTAADIRKPNDKTVDVSESSLARKAEAAKLAGKKSTSANVASEDKKAGAVKTIKVTDPAEKERIMAALTAATKKAASHDPKLDITAKEDKGRGFIDAVKGFAANESGSVKLPYKDMTELKAALKKAFATTDHERYSAKKSAGPVDDYSYGLSTDLHKIAKEDENHKIGVMQKIAALPKELNNEKVMEQIYHAREADSAGVKLPAGQTGTHVDNLPPAIKKLYDEHLKPIFEQNDQFVKNIQAIDPDRIGPDVQHHISRITKGDTSQYNMLKTNDDPTSPRFNGISVNANAAKLRKFYALENAAGDRAVIQPEGNGFKIWRNKKLEKVKAPDFEFEDGGTFTVKTKDGKSIPFTMRQATTKEIEAHARGGDGGSKPMRYYKNAGFSAAVANVQLGSMARHLQELHRLSQTKEFQNLSTTNHARAEELGWEPVNLPNFKGQMFHPELAHVLNDFAGRKEGLYSQLNSAITKLLFWMPTAHLANVFHHWVVGRGWDNVTPSGIRSLVVDTPKAILSVIRQDKLQMDMRTAGAGTIYGGVLTRDMMPKIGKAFHMEIENNPSEWGPIADKLGVPLLKLGKAVYDASTKVMWAGNDMMLTQRVLELQRKGMSMEKAIIDAERDIPNYRVPTKIIAGDKLGRQLQQIATNPALMSFGRYHYGLMNSYANIVKGAIGKDATAGDRLEAVGKMMAMGMLGLAFFPLMDIVQKKITGNEAATQQRRGPLTIPHHLADAAEGKTDVMAAVRGVATLPPLYTSLLETVFNKDFRGKQIVEPGDLKNAVHGSPVAAGRAALQFGSHIVRGTVSPLNTLSNATQKDIGPLGMLRDQATDAKNPSAKAAKYEKLINMHNQRDTLQRFRKGGSDPLEAAYNKLFGYK